MIVDLSEASGTFAVEWFNPGTGNAIPANVTTGGGSQEFIAPFDGDAVLYIANREQEK